MLAFLNTPTFLVFSPPTYFNPAFILRFYLSFIFYLAFIYCVLLFTNIIYHVMRTDTCNKPHTLRDAVTGRTETEVLCSFFLHLERSRHTPPPCVVVPRFQHSLCVVVFMLVQGLLRLVKQVFLVTCSHSS